MNIEFSMTPAFRNQLTFFSFILLLTCSSFLLFKNNPNDEYKLLYPSYFGAKVQWTNDTLKMPIVELGRFLFYDKRLSGANTVSCASCHLQKFAFTDNKRLSNGTNGITTRNSMSLSNLLWQNNFFWDGRARTLEEQALIPIQNEIEMNQHLDSLLLELNNVPLYRKLFLKAYGSKEITPQKIAKAIAQFEKTLISSNSKFDRYLSGDSNALNKNEKNGFKLFSTMPDPNKKIRGAGCTSCHSSPLFLSYSFQNNGLEDDFSDKGIGAITKNPLEDGKFKIPSLRNVALTAPYMHDGRFGSLKDVLAHYNGPVKNSPSLASFLIGNSNDENGKTLGLTTQETEDIIAFLNALTDEKLTTKKEYSDPF